MRKAGRRCNIREAAVAILAIQAIPVGRVTAPEIGRYRLRILQVTAVHQEDIEQAIIIVIEQRDSAAHRLDQVFLRSRGIAVSEFETGGFDKFHGRALRRRRQERGAETPVDEPSHF